MAEQNHKFGEDRQSDLDRLLDTTLAKYTAVEPRAGLEDRVLANLRVPQTPLDIRTWWRWGLAVAFAVVIVMTGLALKWGRSPAPVVEHHPSILTPASRTPAPQVAAKAEGNQVRLPRLMPERRVNVRRSRPKIVVAANPKLDQFPSPRPLSEQEKLALDYIREFPEEANLIARAQTNTDQQEETENVRSQPATASPGNENQE